MARSGVCLFLIKYEILFFRFFIYLFFIYFFLVFDARTGNSGSRYQIWLVDFVNLFFVL